MGIVCPLDALIVELGLQIIGVWPGVRCNMWQSGLAELLTVWEAWMRNVVRGCGRGCLGGLLGIGGVVKLAHKRLRSCSGCVTSAKHGHGNTTRDMHGIGFGAEWTHHTIAGSGSGIGMS